MGSLPRLRVALIYDDSVRADTTGGYCLRALEASVAVTHVRPRSSDEIPADYDLIFRVDDGLPFRLPPGRGPSALWAIDTHVTYEQLRQQARDFGVVFTAQKEGAEQFLTDGIPDCEWLPLACDPEIHCRLDLVKEYDVAFVGHIFPGPRQELLEQVQRRFRRSFVGQVPHTEMAAIYSRARIVVNRSLNNDLNMRVFEALSCGALLVTDRLRDNGQQELFQDRVHLVEYQNSEEALDLISYFLAHDDERRAIAEAGHGEARAHHTYQQRMAHVLARMDPYVRGKAPPREEPTSTGGTTLGRDRMYYHWPRHELLELVPRQARAVLDIGCAAGVLGERLKQRQPCRVVGVELEPEAAREARQRLDEVMEGDVESLDLSSLGRFDAVVCGDVLEHLRKPEDILRKLRGLLEGGGVLIASFPNARHMDVVLNLVEGNWTYQPSGLLDRDHLRFFTRRSAEQLLEDAGFEVLQVRAVPATGFSEWEQTGRPGELSAGRLGISGLSAAEAGEFFVGQWLMTARPAPRVDWGLTSIVIVTWDQFRYTGLCLDSIRKHTHLPYEVIVVDNGSRDDTVDWLREQPDVRLIENATNLGFPKAANQGLAAATGEQVLLLNNDTVVTPGWLRRLLEHLHAASDVGLVGPLTNFASGSQQISVPYRGLHELDGFAWELGRAQRGQSVTTDRLVGFCLLMKREAIDKVGLLDERFGLGCFEDDDICRRALQRGYRLLICRDAFIHHFGGRTFIGHQLPSGQILGENRRRFQEKWQLDSQPQPAPPREADAEPALTSEAEERRPQKWRIGRHRSGGLLLEPGRPTISLCMIVRDEEPRLASCLKSVRPFVDEMIVVDTGSQDRTPGIARELGAKVIETAWQDSFAAARNTSLQHATGDWIFWLDADDVLPEESGTALRRCAENAKESVLGFIAQVRCPAGPGEHGETVVDHVKLFRNRPELRFELRIHEQILPAIRRAGGEIQRSSIQVLHAHYDHSSAGQQKKRERDRRLLELDLKEHPDHPFVHFNLGMTAAHENDYQRAAQHLQQSIRLSDPLESHVRKAYALLASCHRSQGSSREALQVCREGRAIYPDDPELLFNEALACQLAGDLERAADLLEQLLARPAERDHIASLDVGIMSYKARHNLGAIYQQLGRMQEAERCWLQVTQEESGFLPAWLALGDLLLDQGKQAEHDSLAHRAHAEAGEAIGQLLWGRSALRRGDLSAAETRFRAAVACAPECHIGHRLLSYALLQSGQEQEAEGALRQLIVLAPDDAEAHHNLAGVLAARNEDTGAILHYEAAVRLRPEYLPSQQLLQQARQRLGGSASQSREQSP